VENDNVARLESRYDRLNEDLWYIGWKV